MDRIFGGTIWVGWDGRGQYAACDALHATKGGSDPRSPEGRGRSAAPKGGVAPALLSAFPASTFGVFSSRIYFACFGVGFARFREPSREPCREPTYERFSGELGVRRSSSSSRLPASARGKP